MNGRRLEGLPDLLTIREAATLLRVGKSTAYEMARRGSLPVLLVGRGLRVPRRALEQWLESACPLEEEAGYPDADPGGAGADHVHAVKVTRRGGVRR